MEEIELKFEVPADRHAALLAAMHDATQDGGPSEQRLRAIYFDTEDDALARHRVALRLRREGTQWVQTLKASTEASMRRLESNVAVPSGVDDENGDGGAIADGRDTDDVDDDVFDAGDAGDAGDFGEAGGRAPALDPSLHEGTPAGEALRRALVSEAAEGHDGVLLVRYETDVQRISRDIGWLDLRVEVSLDMGWIMAGGERTPVSEIEFELKDGPAEGLVMLAGRWAAEHGLWLNTVSKAERGSRLARGERYGPSVKAGRLELDRHDSPAAVWRRVVAHCLEQISANASEVAAGSSDEEHVHQLRVGIRRLRTALREMARFGPPVQAGWDLDLRDVFVALGEVRDRETVLAQVEPQLDAAGAPAAIAPEVADEANDTDNGNGNGNGDTLAALVQASRFQSTLLQLLRTCVGDDLGDAAAPKDTAKALFARRLASLHNKALADRKRFVSLEPELQHRVRKRVKRLRYLAEFAASLFKTSAVKQYLDELRPLQDALGDHHDQVVALSAYRERAVGDVRAAFAAGWLSAQLPASAAECQRSLKRFADAEPFWKRHD